MKKGIDVSKHNKIYDFNLLKKNIDFIIQRCAYRGIRNRKIFIDEKYHENMKKINELDIPVGIYIYSTARNIQEAHEEALFCLELAKKYKITYPIVIDIEDQKNQGNLSRRDLTDIIITFCKTIEFHNYYAMYYCSKHWYLNKIYPKELKQYDVWIAQWNTKRCDIDCGIWQASSKGKIKGISSFVDINYAYKDYPSIMQRKDLNRFKNIDYKIGDYVEFNQCYSSSDSCIALKPLYGYGKITKILEDKPNPYLINNGSCWIGKKDIVR